MQVKVLNVFGTTERESGGGNTVNNLYNKTSVSMYVCVCESVYVYVTLVQQIVK